MSRTTTRTAAPTRRDVRRRARLGQIGALVFAGAGVGVAAFGLPGAGLEPINTTPRQRTADASGATTPEIDAPPTDYALLSDWLSSVGKVTPPEKPKDPVPDPTPTAGNPETANPQTPATTGPDVTYLGSIVEPGRRLALLRIDNVQRFVREGDVVDGVELLLVEPDSARIRVNDAERSIRRAPRKGQVATEIDGRDSPIPALGRDRVNPRDRANRPSRGNRDR